MRESVLGEIIQFALGKNPTRLNVKEENLYTPEDFERDLFGQDLIHTNAGCIINLINTKCAPISVSTESKCITSNFLRCMFDQGILNPWYFCYQFNEGKDFKRQIAMYHQGTTLSVKKLNVSAIEKLVIRLPDIGVQNQIGDLYRLSLIQYNQMIGQAENMKQFMFALINKMEER